MSVVQVFCKHCGKRKNCSKWAISHFSTVFSTLLENLPIFSLNFKLLSANSVSLKKSKIRGKGLRITQTFPNLWGNVLTLLSLASDLDHSVNSTGPGVAFPDCGILVPNAKWDVAQHAWGARLSLGRQVASTAPKTVQAWLKNENSKKHLTQLLYDTTDKFVQ